MDAIIADGKTFRVDPDRCIGCGLCVTRCKPESRQADQERQDNRAADEHRDFVFKHPDGKSRQKKDDRQYAEASFRETLMNFLQGEDPE
ncbi:MAG: 4Fe-4S binding protein [Desulfobacterales bacterium]|nr:4Fe-4S binding protein [Desulfobacterales bacterium]